MADPIQLPVTVWPGAGKTVRVVTDLMTFKTYAADTGGAYSLFETRTAPGRGTPPHRQLQTGPDEGPPGPVQAQPGNGTGSSVSNLRRTSPS